MSDLAAANQVIAQLYTRIGEHIKLAREQRGISQQDVASAVGLSRSAVANVESGRQRAPVHVLVAACQALGVDAADIITRALEGTDPLASVLSREATHHTARLRKQLVNARGHIDKLLAELPQESP